MSFAPPVIFADFDGTIVHKDVGYSLFHHFSGGRNESLIPDWKAGRLSSRECLLKEAEMVSVTAEAVDAFLRQFTLDIGFADFEAACREQDIPLIILSDGLDLYIRNILGKYSLDHLPVFCNHARIIGRRLEIEFPRQSEYCTRCGNCKGERIREYRGSHESPVTAVFVGDGMSDTCGVQEADLVFAKKDLARYCDQEQIGYTEYQTFSDVAISLRQLKLLA